MKSSLVLETLSRIRSSPVGDMFAVDINRSAGLLVVSLVVLVGTYLYLVPNSLTVRISGSRALSEVVQHAELVCRTHVGGRFRLGLEGCR